MSRGHRSIRYASCRPAFTLLEVMLALGLTVVVLGALAWAIQINLRASNSGRGDVARAQLARALLRRISDDVRGAIWHEPLVVELPPASTPAASSAGGGDEGGSSGPGAPSGSGGSEGAAPATPATPARPSGPTMEETGDGDGGGDDDGDGDSGDGGSSGSSSGGTSGSEDPPPDEAARPGLFGGPDWLEVDVSRLPRVDQFDQSMGVDSASMELISDVKTVAYYLANASTMAGRSSTGLAADTATAGSGLWRREADKAVTLWAMQNGGASNLEQSAQQLAPEVQAIAFEYFDGSGWYTEWDSRVRKGLPMSMRISVWLLATGDTAAAPAANDENRYELVVRLPAGTPTSLPEGEDDSQSPSDSDSEPGGDGSGAGGSGAGSGSSAGGEDQ